MTKENCTRCHLLTCGSVLNRLAASEGSLLRYSAGALTTSMVKGPGWRQTGGRYISRLRKGLRQSSTWRTAAKTVQYWYFWCTFELVPWLPHQQRTKSGDQRSEFLVLYSVRCNLGLITRPLVFCNFYQWPAWSCYPRELCVIIRWWLQNIKSDKLPSPSFSVSDRYW